MFLRAILSAWKHKFWIGLKAYTSAFYLYNILNSNKKIDTEFMFNFFKNGKNYII